ncbi:Ankyrin repeat domain-containing protein SOWAHC [Oryzias melastigma]|uniref:Ankyrin repeat domain-containing protein SOWAHC n=1 Tax=Oryzias melastigma TaxID=30732 RepID=A0A834C8V5_ORYME|nr:Ankyrin repeat domain-containing protein SOWAHC [Oryzias melastigma]
MAGSPQLSFLNEESEALPDQSHEGIQPGLEGLGVEDQLKDPNNPEDHNEQSRQMSSQCLVQDLDQEEQIQDCVEKESNLTSATTNQEEVEESGGGVPALVVTEAEESRRVTPAAVAASRRAQRPADLVISSPSFGGDGADMNCCDLLSPRSDSFSVTSDSRRSEDDTSSVAASSVMSLFHRVQLDPLEKDWLRSSALGNTAAQRILLTQEPGLILKKTALHWAAKQGRRDAVDMMLRSGADVNVRSGYTALHLASIHGHEDTVRTLISSYNAKTNIRDYHGKMAVHYWKGSTDVFNQSDLQPDGSFCRARRMQRFALPSFRLSRSRSHGQLHLEFRTLPQTASHDALDLHV